MPRPIDGKSTTTIRIDADVKRRMKSIGAMRDLSFEQMIEQIAREWLKENSESMV